MRIGHQNREPDETAERSEPVSAADRTDDTDLYVDDVEDTDEAEDTTNGRDTFTGRHAAGPETVSDSDAAGITTPVYLHDTTAARDTADAEDTTATPATPTTIRGETVSDSDATGATDATDGEDIMSARTARRPMRTSWRLRARRPSGTTRTLCVPVAPRRHPRPRRTSPR
jgi:hypothetical protein